MSVQNQNWQFQERLTKTGEAIKSAKRDGNKEIADFNLQKSEAIFAKKLCGSAFSYRSRTAFCTNDLRCKSS
jgi:hypothetical protein